jgi:hypothetical protein
VRFGAGSKEKEMETSKEKIRVGSSRIRDFLIGASFQR